MPNCGEKSKHCSKVTLGSGILWKIPPSQYCREPGPEFLLERNPATASTTTSYCSKSAKAVGGVVFMAEQEEPVRRRVALKVIKPGMDTKSVIARFEAERQALALM